MGEPVHDLLRAVGLVVSLGLITFGLACWLAAARDAVRTFRRWQARRRQPPPVYVWTDRPACSITFDPEQFTPPGWTYAGRFGVDQRATILALTTGKANIATPVGLPMWVADYPDAEWPKDMHL
jgi:hypothetical protein